MSVWVSSDTVYLKLRIYFERDYCTGTDTKINILLDQFIIVLNKQLTNNYVDLYGCLCLYIFLLMCIIIANILYIGCYHKNKEKPVNC